MLVRLLPAAFTSASARQDKVDRVRLAAAMGSTAIDRHKRLLSPHGRLGRCMSLLDLVISGLCAACSILRLLEWPINRVLSESVEDAICVRPEDRALRTTPS
jgi:hypothetical protein